MDMKLEYDKEVDAAYIYLKFPMKEGECKKTIEVNKNIIIDLDHSGKVLGIEVLNASKVLNKAVLKEAVIQI